MSQKLKLSSNSDREAMERDDKGIDDGSSSDSDGSERMTEYEKLREARIARNEAFLSSLGLSTAGAVMREKMAKKKTKRPRKKVGPDFVKRSSSRFEGKTFNFKDKNENEMELRREEQEERRKRREVKQYKKDMQALEKAIIRETKNRVAAREKIVREIKKAIKVRGGWSEGGAEAKGG